MRSSAARPGGDRTGARERKEKSAGVNAVPSGSAEWTPPKTQQPPSVNGSPMQQMLVAMWVEAGAEVAQMPVVSRLKAAARA